MNSDWIRGRHIVITNWRDHDHPQAGGAELYCFGVARRLVALGARVTVLTSRSGSGAKSVDRDGARVIRVGGRFTVYGAVLRWLWAHRREVDGVLDCQNGIPFFAPIALGRRVPIVLLVHHVHQDQFEYHFGRHLAAIGRFLEGPASRVVYGGRAAIAVSPSTRSEVRARLGLRGSIYVVPNGLPARVQAPSRARSSRPRIVVVGRLVPQKRLDILLEAVRDLAARRADVTLDVVGDGSELPFLRQLAIDLGIEAIVSFHGRVDDQTRDALLQTAWLTVNPSMREGWGLSVLEANRLGVPAIAFDVPGLRDAVRDGSTGWLVGPTRTLTETLDAAVATLADEDAAAAYARRARRWAANFSWERTGDRVAGVLAAESSRISVERCNRQATDLVTKVDIDADASVLASVLKEARLDDEWRLENGRLLGLLYGADEDGAETALARLNLTAARIGLAGSTDLLGRADSQQLHAVAEVVSAFRQTVGNPSSPDAVSASRAD